MPVRISKNQKAQEGGPSGQIKPSIPASYSWQPESGDKSAQATTTLASFFQKSTQSLTGIFGVSNTLVNNVIDDFQTSFADVVIIDQFLEYEEIPTLVCKKLKIFMK